MDDVCISLFPLISGHPPLMRLLVSSWSRHHQGKMGRIVPSSELIGAIGHRLTS